MRTRAADAKPGANMGATSEANSDANTDANPGTSPGANTDANTDANPDASPGANPCWLHEGGAEEFSDQSDEVQQVHPRFVGSGVGQSQEGGELEARGVSCISSL